MLGTLAVILVFGGLIFFHELGHFTIARFFGMGVKTFSLGFGPALFSFQRGKTVYQLAAIPLGGFCSLVGEEKIEDLPKPFTLEESFSLRPAWQRFFVVLGGSLFNLILAWLICWGIAYAYGRPYMLPEIGRTQAESAAQRSGLLPGDMILSISGQPVERWEQISGLVQASQGKALLLEIKREATSETGTAAPGGEPGKINAPSEPAGTSATSATGTTGGATGEATGENTRHSEARPGRQAQDASQGASHILSIEVTPDRRVVQNIFGDDQELWIMGIEPSNNRIFQELGFWEAAKTGVSEAYRMLELTLEFLKRLLSGKGKMEEVGSAVSIARVVHAQTEHGLSNVLFIAALISVNLGVLNLLPIPVLDGGTLLFLTIEMIFRKPVPESFRIRAAMIGMALLLSLTALLMVKDIAAWVRDAWF